MNIKKTILAIIAMCLFQVIPSFAMEVAITVDDLPANGELPAHMTRMDIAKKMLTVFKKHHIEGVYGLINGSKIKETISGNEILQEWVREGQLLGNHTYNHPDLVKTTSEEYIADISKNEPILSQFMTNKDYHYFRYTFLAEGNTQEKRDTVRQFLFKNHYKIAPVTVDFFEYEWNDAYVRCLKKNDKQSIAWLKKAYIEQANNALIISHTLSTMLFNRDIKNVLLIHINVFTAEMLDEFLTNYEKQNVRFVSMPEALSDEVYNIDPNVVRERSYTFLNQVRLSRGLKNPDTVEKLYNSFPDDKLSKLCT